MMFRTPRRSTLLATALTAALLPGLAIAQDAAAPEASAEAAAQLPAEPVVVATNGSWQVMCNQVEDIATQNCEMYQLLLDPAGQPIAEIGIAVLPFGSEFSAGATVTTPLETFLPTGMGWRIGAAEEMRIEPFRVCTVIGCIIRMGLSAEEVDAMRAGTTATVTIAPFAAIDQPVEITVSLAGFTASFDDLQTRLSNAAAAARTNP